MPVRAHDSRLAAVKSSDCWSTSRPGQARLTTSMRLSWPAPTQRARLAWEAMSTSPCSATTPKGTSRMAPGSVSYAPVADSSDPKRGGRSKRGGIGSGPVCTLSSVSRRCLGPGCHWTPALAASWETGTAYSTTLTTYSQAPSANYKGATSNSPTSANAARRSQLTGCGVLHATLSCPYLRVVVP